MAGSAEAAMNASKMRSSPAAIEYSGCLHPRQKLPLGDLDALDHAVGAPAR